MDITEQINVAVSWMRDEGKTDAEIVRMMGRMIDEWNLDTARRLRLKEMVRKAVAA